MTMSKPKKLGMKTTYVPNAKADMRHRKKVYQRGREKPTIIREDHKAEQGGQGMIIAILIAMVLVTLIVLACCKVSGDCSRQEEKEQRGKQ